MGRFTMTAGAVLLAAAGFAQEPNAQEPERSDAVRVMSFNVRYDNPADGPNAWPHRKDWVAEVIRENADIVGLQEVVKHQLDDLKARLPEFEFYGVGRNDGKEDGEFVPVAWRKDRFEAVATGHFWLSETPDEPGSKSWDSSLPRVSTWARLKDQRTGKTFLHANTHFDHRGQQARLESAKLIKEWIGQEAKGDVAVLTGDFNTGPESKPYQVLVAKDGDTPLRDARASVDTPEGPASTWNGFTAVAPNTRIDFVFTSRPADVTGFRTLDETREGRFPSDHLPIVATAVFDRRD